MFAVKHILVPTDFSETSERALDAAVEIARTFRARLTLLHVWSVPNMGYAEGLNWPLAEMEEAARAALDDVQARTRTMHVETDSVLGIGAEWEKILELVKARNIDLVVMGTHGRRGLSRVLLGSVTERVVRLSPVPVLTIRGPLQAEKEEKSTSSTNG